MNQFNKRLDKLEAIKPIVRPDHSGWLCEQPSDDEIVYSLGRHYFLKGKKDANQ